MTGAEGITDAERAVIGLVLDRPSVIRTVEDLDPADFASPALGALWGLMLRLDAQSIPPEPVAVAAHLGPLGMPALTPLLLADLLHDAPVTVPATVCARRVRDQAVLRRLDSAAIRIRQIVAGDGDPDEAVELARAEVDACTRAIATVTLLDEEIDQTLAMLAESEVASIKTPWPDLDHLIQGWRPGGLYVIGARPGVGKTLLALQAAAALAERGIVAFHSLEMPRREVHVRLLAQMADVAMVRMDKRTLSPRDWQHLEDARGRIPTGTRLAIDDRAAVRVVDIRSHARTLARRGSLAAVVVDYLQLMSGARGDRRPRHEQVAEWSRQLKLLAKELDVPVIVASQLNRQVEGRSDRRPSMADLRESGAIEQDADVILLLHVDEDADPSEMHVLVAKNRQGQTGDFRLQRRGEVARLDPWQWRPHLAAVPDDEPDRRHR